MQVVRAGWEPGNSRTWKIVIRGDSPAEGSYIRNNLHKVKRKVKGKPKVSLNGDGTITLSFGPEERLRLDEHRDSQD
jgi:hypothetical protein